MRLLHDVVGGSFCEFVHGRLGRDMGVTEWQGFRASSACSGKEAASLKTALLTHVHPETSWSFDQSDRCALAQGLAFVSAQLSATPSFLSLTALSIILWNSGTAAIVLTSLLVLNSAEFNTTHACVSLLFFFEFMRLCTVFSLCFRRTPCHLNKDLASLTDSFFIGS